MVEKLDISESSIPPRHDTKVIHALGDLFNWYLYYLMHSSSPREGYILSWYSIQHAGGGGEADIRPLCIPKRLGHPNIRWHFNRYWMCIRLFDSMPELWHATLLGHLWFITTLRHECVSLFCFTATTMTCHGFLLSCPSCETHTFATNCQGCGNQILHHIPQFSRENVAVWQLTKHALKT